MRRASVLVLLLAAAAPAGCGDANDQLIGAECTATSECANDELTCLSEFKGGYCGASGCTRDADCPDGSMCVTYEGANYCFLVCTDKAQCNENRTTDNEANCSSSIDRVEATEGKACIPPTGS